MKLLILVCTALLLTGCASSPQGETEAPATVFPTVTETTAPETEPEPTLSPEETILNSMTLRQKVGQLFLVRPDALNLGLSPAEIEDPNFPGATEVTAALAQNLEQYPVGGFVQFSKNILDPDQLSAFNRQLSLSLPIPPFISVDEEGGAVARLGNTPSFSLPRYPSAGAVCAEGQSPAALDMGLTIGDYLRRFGFNMDFAPVADVNTNPRNLVIGTRAFSSDPQLAAECARAMADGLTENGIIPVFKHFPGHGDTGEDSHKGLAVSNKTIDEMESCEWLSFRQAGSLDCIMVGHIALPQVTGDMIPATLSYPITAGLLRTQLGFEGLIITDSMTMGAITQDYTSSQAALLALEAGCDLILMPQSLPEAFDGVVEAVESGSFPEYELDETVLRILRFKKAHGIL